MNDRQAAPRHHLLIAGQGRSGTSLLVRILSACGLETHLEKHGQQAWFDDTANAGFEDSLFIDESPYVVKSPWSYQFLEQVLRQGHVVIDHAIVPVRKLREAAASRVILEIQHRSAGQFELFAESGGAWDHFGTAPGGVVYSLEPLDQERILASGFTRLVEVLVRHDVPVTFLDFPRFTSDPLYLFDKLRVLFPAELGRDEFCRRVAPLIDPAKVRVESELGTGAAADAGGDGGRPTLAELDAAAQRRLLQAAMKERDALTVERDRLNAERDALAAARDSLAAERDSLVAERDVLVVERDTAASGRNALALERDTALAERNAAALERDRLAAEAARLAAELQRITRSVSWRLTRPLRALFG